MKIVLGIAVVVAAASPAAATAAFAPGPELAGSIPAVLAVVGAFAATRLRRRK